MRRIRPFGPPSIPAENLLRRGRAEPGVRAGCVPAGGETDAPLSHVPPGEGRRKRPCRIHC
jgi:hypothetical protein